MGQISSEVVNKGAEEQKSKEIMKVFERRFSTELEKILDLMERTGCSIVEAMDTLKIFNNREIYIELMKNKKSKEDLKRS